MTNRYGYRTYAPVHYLPWKDWPLLYYERAKDTDVTRIESMGSFSLISDETKEGGLIQLLQVPTRFARKLDKHFRTLDHVVVQYY